ncbi:MAG TPA: hypothetical protein DCQ26_18780 [Marinilabiliales bacterium]|nr:MAG: hypothetical protein A2W95_07465 [Bacteroidetes bacterium GWA2_40_14]OFX59243.1 MAG: hypothetical protein A2W84_04055 [Bacteroidetes bacterium GWC2_40_13]OFX75376.1 MAG: hypothetical protein A2W96_19845 [Bacteroidetes bacterium GWD2_40_43]OFX90657.1 MAG: hypothetical protein A2W97_02685 [Bacteroidetes bacterium GWE2_40_63]OFY20866.1 MAG: hypothetical protein A2W88_17580 [Bacteroidetes bacterium GWF2_40_13]OFZ23714.1 MAG: hypothetical protein A2437_06670 [Bacteroidetes bacterium RIFOXYC
MYKNLLILFHLAVINTVISFGQIPTDYYKGTEGLTGTELETFLRNVINEGFQGISYGDARYILDETDADPNIEGNVVLVYLGISVSGVWDSGITWNREHVWPQSLLNTDVSNSTIGVGSDLHNLKPADPAENSSRSNDYFDVEQTADTYVPRDEVKGDIARILFYMTVMYDYLELVNSAPLVYEMAKLDVLLSWHKADPVDDFERNRNEVIYSYQKNRNPFIDHPEFVAQVWNLTALNDKNYKTMYVYPNPARDYLHISATEGFQTFRILNMIGQTVKEGTFGEPIIPLDGLSKGKYIVQLINKETVSSLPFIIN